MLEQVPDFPLQVPAPAEGGAVGRTPVAGMGIASCATGARPPSGPALPWPVLIKVLLQSFVCLE
jgi:hypothetical protein